MNENKTKVIGVRFDDITHARLVKLADDTHDTMSSIIRRATAYCIPMFENSNSFLVMPEVIDEISGITPVTAGTEPDDRRVDILDIIMGGDNGSDTGNDSEEACKEVAEGERSMGDGDQ